MLQALYLLLHLLLNLFYALLCFNLHLLYEVSHMQDSFNACEIDTQIFHQAANLNDTLDIAVRV